MKPTKSQEENTKGKKIRNKFYHIIKFNLLRNLDREWMQEPLLGREVDSNPRHGATD